jgi:hypothetical protein
MKMMMNKIFTQHHHHVCSPKKTIKLIKKNDFVLLIIATHQQQDSSSSLFTNSNNPEHTRIYNQAVLLNSLVRNMVNESEIQNSSSNESCYSNDTQVKKKKIDLLVNISI